MSKSLRRSQALPAKVRAALDKAGLTDIEIGGVYIDKDGYYARVINVRTVKGGTGDRKWKRTDIVYQRLATWDGEWQDKESSKSIEDWKHYKFVRVYGDIRALEDAAWDMARNPPDDDEVHEDHVTTALVLSGGSERVYQIRDQVRSRMQKVNVSRRIVARQVERLNSIVRNMQDQLKQIMKVIGALELYLGVYEDIVQIAEGDVAPIDTPVTIRQLVLYMDEECGDPRDGGIDFTKVEDFDDWVTKDIANLNRMLPESKGLVAIKPSRQYREYSENPFFNAKLNAENQMVYLLVRNGTNVYRIWTSLHGMDDKLYPGADELQRIVKVASESPFSDGEKAKDVEFAYKRNALLIQGIFDRTELFVPLPFPIDLLDPMSYDDMVQFIRDAEPALPDGRLPYNDWKKQINAQIGQGSRVYFCGSGSKYNEYHHQNFVRYYRKGTAPNGPSRGVYLVERIEPPRNYHSERLVIYYNPGDEVWYGAEWDYDPHTRKNRLGYYLYANDKDVLAYDFISLEDVDFYINCRTERKHYLDMMPALLGIRDARLAEIEYERELVKLVSGRLDCDSETVWSAIHWWKLKNKWKRGLDKDDALALRMIERRIKRELGQA